MLACSMTTVDPHDHELLAPTRHLQMTRMNNICWTLAITPYPPALYFKNTAHIPPSTQNPRHPRT